MPPPYFFVNVDQTQLLLQIYNYTAVPVIVCRIPEMDKIKSSICFSCCFGSEPNRDHRDTQQQSTSFSLMQTSSTWIRSKAQELPGIRGKCRGLISRIGKNRRHHSTDFRYDPFSYALNFDGGPDFDEDGDGSSSPYKYKSFSSRLPASPRLQPSTSHAQAQTDQTQIPA